MVILILTLNSVVSIRQHVFRYRNGKPIPPAGVLFVNVSRRDADHGFFGSVQFLFNYGFYKFGLEFTVLSIILLVGYRMDIMSLMFSISLFLFSLLQRTTIKKIWPFFTGFIATLIPIQYLLSLGLPIGLCAEYPWTDTMSPDLRAWLYLPSFQITPNVKLLIYDFVVLLLASRQWIVFNTETLMLPQNGGGGSNAETFNEPNQQKILKGKDEVPDFFTFSKTALDHVKSVFFSCFYWVTLAVVFLTATGRRNLFGLGYILGCFFFLWNGSEFYLKPLQTIIKTWKIILAYTASVILLKTILQVSLFIYIYLENLLTIHHLLIFINVD